MSKILSTIILISLSLLLATTSLRAQQQDGQQDVMVVLDASGSMWGQIDGTPKIDIARGVMGKMLSDLGSKANIGGAASAPVVAAAFHPSLAPVGVLLAVVGYALGTYGAYLCALMMQAVSH